MPGPEGEEMVTKDLDTLVKCAKESCMARKSLVAL